MAVQVPYAFLDLYPHPVFVLPADWDPQRDPTWSNLAWRHCARGRSLLECSSDDACAHITAWLGKTSPLRIDFVFGSYSLAQTAVGDGFVITSIPAAGTTHSGSGRQCDDVASAVLDTLRDVGAPFSILYRAERHADDVTLTYSGAVSAAPASLTIPLGRDGDASPFATALRTRRPVVVDGAEIGGIVPRDLSTAAVIPVDVGLPDCVAVVGLPFAQSDAECDRFVHSLRTQMASHPSRASQHQRDIHQLATIDMAKNQLLANVANELMTPIGLISGPLDDLKHEIAEDSAAAQLVRLARRNIGRLSSLVGKLVEVSVMHHTPETAHFVRTNLGAFTRDVSSMFTKAIERLEIDCDLADNPVYIDRRAWEKIIVTLLRMATRYNKGLVRVAVAYDSARALFTCAGIVDFYIAEVGSLSSETDAPGGVVLDYALVKQLVDLHGGTLAVDGGIAISVPLGSDHLPQGSVHQGSELAPYELGMWDDAEDGDAPAMSMRVYGVDRSLLHFESSDAVLLVDDADSTRYMRTIFQPFCKVYEARNKADALGIIAETPPTLVVADAMLPMGDGEGLLAAMRGGSRAVRMIPVILLTDHDLERPDAGADDYLLRPFNARELLVRGHMQMQMGKRRVLLENMYEQRADEMRLLMDESPVGIFRGEPDGAVTYYNETLYNMSGHPRDADLRDWALYLKEEFRQPLIDAWETCLRTPEQVEYTMDAQWKAGRWFTVRTKKIFRFDECVALVGCVTDTTEARLAEELQVERARVAEERRRDAENAKAEVDLLVDITSHEIRNPISSLMQCASLVRTNLVGLRAGFERGGFRPTSQLMETLQEDIEALDSIYACGLAQERISNDVLALGKAQLDLLEIHSIDVNVVDEVRRIVSVFQNEARMGRIQLSLEFSDAFRRVEHVMLDPVRFGQIVTNLLANAVRFVASSEVRRLDVHVDMGTSPPQNGTCLPAGGRPVGADSDAPLYLYVAVADTGPGLLPAELETLFQRFSQASSKTHTVFGGSGLGLFVCRKIAELMGGRIEVASRYAEGSVFRFFVKTRASQTRASVPAQAAPAAPHVSSKLRVLIVEDNIINRQVLARQLKHVGLAFAVNGLEAVQRLRSSPGRFDCVLMDLEMPVMDGYAATRTLREDEARGAPANVFIALTGNARQAKLEDRMRDFDDVIVKPYRLDDLLRKVEAAARRGPDAPHGSAELAADATESAVDEEPEITTPKPTIHPTLSPETPMSHRSTPSVLSASGHTPTEYPRGQCSSRPGSSTSGRSAPSPGGA